MNETALDAGTLSAVIDVAPTPLWVIGPDGAVALANQAALTMLGYRSVDDVIGAPSHDTLHEWHPDGSRYPSHACPILDGCGSTSVTAHEWFITRTGQPIPVTWSAKPLGTSGARLLTFVDATERIAATTRTPDHHDLAPTRSELRARLLRSPASEIRRHRLEHADSLIARGSSVGHACRASGFTDQGTFNRAFRRQYGVPPCERAGRAG